MVGRYSSCSALADHYRDLAQLMSDERTHHVLLEMARELEARKAVPDAMPGQIAPQPIPRSLS
jgi:hypothetical protein